MTEIWTENKMLTFNNRQSRKKEAAVIEGQEISKEVAILILKLFTSW